MWAPLARTGNWLVSHLVIKNSNGNAQVWQTSGVCLIMRNFLVWKCWHFYVECTLAELGEERAIKDIAGAGDSFSFAMHCFQFWIQALIWSLMRTEREVHNLNLTFLYNEAPSKFFHSFIYKTHCIVFRWLFIFPSSSCWAAFVCPLVRVLTGPGCVWYCL